MNKNNIVDIIDVEQRHYQTIKETLARFLPYKKVIAYGSRVKWNASETSDLDLAVFDATQKEIYEAKEAFDESNIPFIIQILNWETIPQDFKENIEQKYHILQDKSDWGIFKLGDTIEKNQYSILNNLRKPLSSNIRSKMKDGELYPYYGAAGIIDYINDFKLNGFYLLIAEDGTVTSNGINPMLTLAMGKFWVSNHAHIISSDEDWKIKFLYYLLSSVDINEYITGAVQPKLNKANLLSIKIYLPPLQEQKAIAEILSSLDDKIDLLNRQNKTLENLAETLFRHYFIDNAKDDWKERQLDEIADYLNGLACQKHPPKNDVEKLPVLKIKDLRNGFTENSDWATSDVAEEYIVKNGDIIFSWSGSLLVKIWDGKECVLNQHLFKVTSAEYPKWFIYHWTKYHLDKFTAIAESKATTMGHIKRSDLSSSMVVVPTEDVLNEIDQFMQPIMDKVILNNRQISRLEKLRDTLLPNLISGEIRVNYKENE